MSMHLTAAPFDWPIIAYMVLAGTSAGAAITGCVASLSNSKALEPVAWQSLLVAAILIALGFPLLILDLEQPKMFLSILYYFNPRSAIAWGARGISLYFLLLVVVLLLRHRLVGVLKLPVVVVLVLAIFVGMYPGFVLNQAVARPLWTQSVIPTLFLFSGLHMGLAIATIARLWSAGDPDFKAAPGDPLLHDHIIVRWLEGVLIVIQIVLLGSYFLSCLRVAPEAAMNLTYGSNGIMLWGGVVLVGWVVPGLGMRIRGARGSLLARCICVLVGGVCLRVLLIDGGQGAAAFIGSR